MHRKNRGRMVLKGRSAPSPMNIPNEWYIVRHIHWDPAPTATAVKLDSKYTYKMDEQKRASCQLQGYNKNRSCLAFTWNTPLWVRLKLVVFISNPIMQYFVEWYKFNGMAVVFSRHFPKINDEPAACQNMNSRYCSSSQQYVKSPSCLVPSLSLH